MGPLPLCSVFPLLYITDHSVLSQGGSVTPSDLFILGAFTCGQASTLALY